MSALANALTRAVLDYELPGHAVDPSSTDPYQTMAATYGGLLDAWLIGDLDLSPEDFIAMMQQFSSFDLGSWLESHKDQIDLP